MGFTPYHRANSIEIPARPDEPVRVRPFMATQYLGSELWFLVVLGRTSVAPRFQQERRTQRVLKQQG